MTTWRYSEDTTLTETSPLTHTIGLRVKADGYHINTSGTLNKHGSVLIVSSSSDSDVRSILEFDVASLPSSAVITRVTLQVHVTECRLALPDDAMTLCCSGYMGDGSVTTEDACAGMPVGASLLTNTRITGPVRVDIAPAFVQRTRETGFAGFRLQTSASAYTDRANCVVLRSLENIHPDSAPMLFVEYINENIVEEAADATCVVKARADIAP